MLLNIITLVIMMYYISILKGSFSPPKFCDVFGIGASAQAIGNVASTIATNEVNREIAQSTNKANKDIAEATNATNIAIHEADRQFNAEEAQKTRDWNSEESVMQRRKEAGLNVSTSDSSITAPNATASAPSAPSLVTPTMQAPVMEAPQVDVAGVTNALLNVAKAPSEIRQTEQNISESEARVSKVYSDIRKQETEIRAQEIVNEWNPKVFQTQLALWGSQKNFTDTEKWAIVTRTKNDVSNALMASFNESVQVQQQNTRLHLDLAKLDQDRELLIKDLNQRADNLFNTLKSQMWKESFDFGSIIEKNTSLNRSFGGSFGVGVGADVHGTGGFPKIMKGKLPFDLSFTGGFDTDINAGISASSASGEGSSIIQRVQESYYYREGIKILACVKILEDPKSSRDACAAAILSLYDSRSAIENYLSTRKTIFDAFNNDTSLMMPTF